LPSAWAQIIKQLAAIKAAEEQDLPSARARKQRLGAVAGILTPVLAFTCILLAIASYPSFSWTNNALSDLGVISGVTGPLFNFGLYASGFLGLIFSLLGLFTYVGKGVIGKVGSLFFAATTVALMAIGVFNESFSGWHFAFSAAFFVLAPVSLFIITCAFVLERQTRMAFFTVGIGVIAALPWILQFAFNYVPSVAIPETVSGLAVSAWTIALSYRILKQAKLTIS
jgi:hypothetical membrane protein